MAPRISYEPRRVPVVSIKVLLSLLIVSSQPEMNLMAGGGGAGRAGATGSAGRQARRPGTAPFRQPEQLARSADVDVIPALTSAAHSFVAVGTEQLTLVGHPRVKQASARGGLDLCAATTHGAEVHLGLPGFLFLSRRGCQWQGSCRLERWERADYVRTRVPALPI